MGKNLCNQRHSGGGDGESVNSVITEGTRVAVLRAWYNDGGERGAASTETNGGDDVQSKYGESER